MPIASQNLLNVSSIEDSYIFWNNVYDWSRYQGDEWSARWGGADVQWFWTIYPRIRQHLPSPTILEIGSGHGRWSSFLKEHCQQLVLLDLSERCIHACKERFGSDGVTYRVGDGRTLSGVENDSVDFCFSFETLVLVDADVLSEYLRELARVLKPGGTAFWHHSNLGVYTTYFRLKDLVPKRLRRPLKRAGLLDYDEMRSPSVTAAWFEKEARTAGLACRSQELIPWGGKRLIDSFSVLAKEPQERANQVFENPGFIKDAYQIQRLSRLYGEGVPW